MNKIATTDNLTDPFTKALPQKAVKRHLDSLGLRCSYNELWVQVGVCWDCALKPLLYAWDIDIYMDISFYISLCMCHEMIVCNP